MLGACWVHQQGRREVQTSQEYRDFLAAIPDSATRNQVEDAAGQNADDTLISRHGEAAEWSPEIEAEWNTVALSSARLLLADLNYAA